MYRRSGSYNEGAVEEPRGSTHQRWVTLWADSVEEVLRRGLEPEVSVWPLMELVSSPGSEAREGPDVALIAEKIAAMCCQPPLGFSWVVFYLRDGKAFRCLDVRGSGNRRRPAVILLNRAPGTFGAPGFGHSYSRHLPWLPLSALVEDEYDGNLLSGIWALPLIAFGELVGLLCASAEDAWHCSEAGMVAPLVAACAPLAVTFFTLSRFDATQTAAMCARIAGPIAPGERGKVPLPRLSTESQVFRELVGESPAFFHALALAERWAAGCAPVLITGETGTGKELLARAIHALSSRRSGPWVAVNCPAIPRELAESELFGHEKGAFTGATEARVGRFERADGGVLFLDEVGDLPHTIQAKLLRVLQEGEIERVGSAKTKKVDVRVIAATNRDLHEAVRLGDFRKDLYHRLAALPIHLPPLRERGGDVELLAWHFLRKSRERYGKCIEEIAPAAIERLEAYDWPGNVRELEYVIERAVLLAVEPILRVEDLADLAAEENSTGLSLHARLRMEKVRRIEATLRQTQGNCAEAARLLGMSRGNFARLLKALRIDARRFRLD